MRKESELFHRYGRIRREFGIGAVVRVTLLLFGLFGMAVFGLIAFSNSWAAIVAAVGLAVGILLRRVIARGCEYYSRAVPIGLAVYGFVLFLGGSVGLTAEAKLLLITATTVIVFDLQFWSFSDQTVVNTRRQGS